MQYYIVPLKPLQLQASKTKQPKYQLFAIIPTATSNPPISSRGSVYIVYRVYIGYIHS